MRGDGSVVDLDLLGVAVARLHGVALALAVPQGGLPAPVGILVLLTGMVLVGFSVLDMETWLVDRE